MGWLVEFVADILEVLIIWRAREWSPLRMVVAISVVLLLVFVAYRCF